VANLTAKRIEFFLETLAICGNVSRAAEYAGISRTQLYTRRAKDEELAERWDDAALMGGMGLEDEARRRAYDGVEKPVFHKGAMVACVKEYSDTLLIFLLKGLFPEKYADRQKTEHTFKGELAGRLAKALEDKESTRKAVTKDARSEGK
jgi:hypothetical protein